MGDREAPSCFFCHSSLAWFCLMINKLFRNYCQSCEIFVLSDSPNIKMIQLYTRTFSFSSSLPLYVNPPYSTHTFLLQTAQQFTERLDRMLKHTCHQFYHITSYCKAPVVYNVVWTMAFAFPIAAAKYV